MESYEKHVPVLDFLSRKISMSSQWFSEAPENLESLIQEAFDNLEHSKTELSDYVATLQSQNKELKAYAHTVAHDLKMPLNVILWASHLITEKPDLTDAELKDYTREISVTANKMDTIINNLLLFAKVSSAEAPVECVDMRWVIANVLDRLNHLIEEHHAQIDIPESWPVAIGYGPWIEEVWANYFSNAIKYGGTPPHIELGASLQSGRMVRYWMRDNGPGLSVGDQSRLFTPFSQIAPAPNSGNGLGLSIVRRIIEKLGGQTGCESQPGRGSLFFFTLQADLSSC
ncbi:MAG: ATP-binding protein [Anaerolineales bacterium]|nr:MAG: ATP-binding protein [Anaerolineales bacterium]